MMRVSMQQASKSGCCVLHCFVGPGWVRPAECEFPGEGTCIQRRLLKEALEDVDLLRALCHSVLIRFGSPNAPEIKGSDDG